MRKIGEWMCEFCSNERRMVRQLSIMKYIIFSRKIILHWLIRIIIIILLLMPSFGLLMRNIISARGIGRGRFLIKIVNIFIFEMIQQREIF